MPDPTPNLRSRLLVAIGALTLIGAAAFVWFGSRLAQEQGESATPRPDNVSPPESEPVPPLRLELEPQPEPEPVASATPATDPSPTTEPRPQTPEERWGQLPHDELKRVAGTVRLQLNETRSKLVKERLDTGEYEVEIRPPGSGGAVDLGQRSDPFGVQFGGTFHPLADGRVELHKVSLRRGEDPTFDRLNDEYYWLNVRIRELEKSKQTD